ncbi:hypothetical protein THAOC_19637 [Thalassiosira oceanica]|uniref:Uncharacterized protein n=1 Tax=Thalassiosira oceanica TaxID=159749 RepID=K0SNR7_THAOC|nr:hypothetical protein THAOC_19637 [Thalassiosira oceanica]|eukprot:EJK60077.1 hypothetical protein THAOC_19637 [Thalassiosira oceanica]
MKVAEAEPACRRSGPSYLRAVRTWLPQPELDGNSLRLGAPSPRRILADCWALNEHATDYSDATKPVTVNPALFGRCYFYRASDEEGKACQAWTPLWEALTIGRWRVGERCGLTGGPVPAPRPVATRAAAVALCQPALYLIQPLEAGQPKHQLPSTPPPPSPVPPNIAPSW